MDYTSQLDAILTQLDAVLTNQATLISWVQLAFVGLCILLGVFIASVILQSHK